MKMVGRILSTIFLIFAIAAIVYVSYLVINSKKNGQEVYVFGYKPYMILTGSMEPKIKQYGLVIVEKNDFNDIKVGDIISFNMPGIDKHVCHRVVSIDNGVITTKGDNNHKPDLGSVTEANFIGKVVWHNNFTAYYYDELISPYGVWKVVVLPIAVIGLIIIAAKSLSKRGRRKI